MASSSQRPELDGLAAWCSLHLGSRLVEVLFQHAHLSAVTGVRLADGRDAVIKVRPAMARHRDCAGVQQHLWQAGYPCPQPLAGPAPFGPLDGTALDGTALDGTALDGTALARPAPLGPLDATAEAFVPGGTQLAPDPGFAGSFAAALARLIELAPRASAVATLEPPPPWSYWDHHEDGPWPWPDDMNVDLNMRPGPAWLDDAAIRIRSRLERCSQPPVVGHCDWESQNIRWRRGRLHVVHDWDSVISQPEAAIAGQAAAAFAATGAPGEHATVAQSAQFLAAYEGARGQPWTDDDLQVAWASGAWVVAFNAKKDTVDSGRGGRPSGGLAAELAERLRRARA
jgi:hypothetical protein